MAGMPPLSGFLGKLLGAGCPARARRHGLGPGGRILGGSLVTIVGFARAGSALFWKIPPRSPCPPPMRPLRPKRPRPPVRRPGPAPAAAMEIAPSLAALTVLGALAGLRRARSPAIVEDTATQLFDRDGYIGAVLPPTEEG